MRSATLIYLVVICIVAFVCIGFIIPFRDSSGHPTKAEQAAHSMLDNLSLAIENKYGVKICGTGVAMPGGPIREFTLCLQTKHLSQAQLRDLLVKCAQEMLSRIESNQSIQQYLAYHPFKIEHIEVIIYNRGIDGSELPDPLICCADISRGTLQYATNDPDNSFRYKNTFKETYEEALKILRKQ